MPKPLKRITVKWLKERDACAPQVRRFKRRWPNGAMLNARNLREAARLRFSLWWLADKVLSVRQYSRFCKIMNEAFLAWVRRSRQRPDQPLYLAYIDALIKILRLEKRK